jgi:hypothetical protein
MEETFFDLDNVQKYVKTNCIKFQGKLHEVKQMKLKDFIALLEFENKQDKEIDSLYNPSTFRILINKITRYRKSPRIKHLEFLVSKICPTIKVRKLNNDQIVHLEHFLFDEVLATKKLMQENMKQLQKNKDQHIL